MLRLKMWAWAVIALAVGCAPDHVKELVVQFNGSGGVARCWRMASWFGVKPDDRRQTILEFSGMTISQPFAVLRVDDWSQPNALGIDATTCTAVGAAAVER